MSAAREMSKVVPMNRTTVDRPNDRELVVTRTFNAPARILYDAWTKPELLMRWWAPRSIGVTLFSCESDARVGGIYRFVFGHDEKHAMAFSGRYTEVTPTSRLAYTQIFEPMREAGEGLITVTFEEHGGKTQLVSRELYPSKAVLDGAIESGMEGGMRATLEQLEELLTTLV
jgi:uncharacterized protein YndB with AHSA1/START domain